MTKKDKISSSWYMTKNLCPGCCKACPNQFCAELYKKIFCGKCENILCCYHKGFDKTKWKCDDGFRCFECSNAKCADNQGFKPGKMTTIKNC